MSEELSVPPVVDFDAIFQPIGEDAPSGEYLRYVGHYDLISEARRADDNLAQGEWQHDLKLADFPEVIRLSSDALTDKTKDLQIAAWYGEALIKVHGFPGLRDAVKMLAGLQEKFWGSIHPVIDEGDMEGRANAISWFEAQATLAVKHAAIVSGGISFFGFEESKKYDIPANIEALSYEDQDKWKALQAEAEKENRVTGEAWRRARTATNRAFCEKLNVAIAESFEALKELDRVIDEHFDRNQMPGTNSLRKAIDEVQTLTQKILEEKRAEEPSDSDSVEETAEVTADGGAVTTGASVGSPAGAIQNRKDALRRLTELAEFFRKTEPHSPVSYLVQRAVRWGEMPLEGWLQDVIKDESTLYLLRQTLGMNSSSTESSQE